MSNEFRPTLLSYLSRLAGEVTEEQKELIGDIGKKLMELPPELREVASIKAANLLMDELMMDWGVPTYLRPIVTMILLSPLPPQFHRHSMECHGVEIEVTRSPEDDIVVIQIDTPDDAGPDDPPIIDETTNPLCRVYLNDGCLFENPPHPSRVEAPRLSPQTAGELWNLIDDIVLEENGEVRRSLVDTLIEKIQLWLRGTEL